MWMVGLVNLGSGFAAFDLSSILWSPDPVQSAKQVKNVHSLVFGQATSVLGLC